MGRLLVIYLEAESFYDREIIGGPVGQHPKTHHGDAIGPNLV